MGAVRVGRERHRILGPDSTGLRVAACVALVWVVHSLYAYPPQYVFRFDPDVWPAQLLTWLMILGGGILLGAGAAAALAVFRRAAAAGSPPRGVSGLARRAEAALSSRWAPVAAGLAAAAVQWWIQGSLRPAPVIHDEAAYLLQAKLYATGRWIAPPAPIPDFFQQMYVFVTPFTASKYPPGFPLALVPGVWIGLPGLVPVVLVGIAGGLLFGLAREIGNPWIAGFAWLLWTGNPHGRAIPGTLMSEQLSTALWLAAWWTLLRWWRNGRTRDLVLLALFVGWGAITRPLSMFAAAIPIGAVVLTRTVRNRAWKPFAAAVAVGTAIVALLPIWNRETTGSWTTSPLALHVRTYTPYDALGFGPPPEPLRPLPPDQHEVSVSLRRSRLRHTVGDIPRLVAERGMEIRADALPGWRLILVPALLYALLVAPPAGLFAAVTCSLDFALYLTLSHPAHLTKYYLETYPSIDFLAAAGVWALLVPAGDSRGRRSLKIGESRTAEIRSVVGMAAVILLIGPSVAGAQRVRNAQAATSAAKEAFLGKIGGISAKRSVVFVRYGPRHEPNRSLIENGPDLESQRVWLVYDRGADNARLRRIAPDRTPYLYDEASGRLIRLDRPFGPADQALVGPSVATP